MSNTGDCTNKVLRPVILELVGPAGAGKTTLRNTLIFHFNGSKLRNYPFFRDMKAAPFFIRHTLRLAPLFLRMAVHHHGRHLTPQEIALMVIMQGWSPALQREAVEDKFTILDQGPVYVMAQLDALGPERMHIPEAQRWLERMYHIWGDTLHTVIYLDTNDLALYQRINTRTNPIGRVHGVVGRSKAETIQFLERSRRSLNQAIEGLVLRNPKLCIYRFNTSEKSAETIAEEVVSIVNHSL